MVINVSREGGTGEYKFFLVGATPVRVYIYQYISFTGIKHKQSRCGATLTTKKHSDSEEEAHKVVFCFISSLS